MSDLKAPRFPYIAALLCAACLGAAAWTWMRYSYCWEIAPEDIASWRFSETSRGFAMGRFIRLRGALNGPAFDLPNGTVEAVLYDPETGEPFAGIRFVGHSADSNWWVTDSTGRHIYLERGPQHVLHAKADTTFSGRERGEVTDTGLVRTFLDTTASRFTGASIAGLVVGAMGVFVFTVALRHWLGERRRFREEARA